MSSKQWVDGPYPLLALPGRVHDRSEHASIVIADDMAIFHNNIIRGINAIYLQAPFVKTEQDITDFLFFVRAWSSWLTAHHKMEDYGLFESFEKVASKPGLLAVNHQQHQEFEDGIHQLHALSDTPPSDYKPEAIRSLIDGFGPAMHKHLTAEIDTLLALRPYDHEGLMKVYETSQAKMRDMDAGTKAMSLPLMFGLHDATYEGGDYWPPIAPEIRNGLIQAFGHQHSGAWRFLPSDLHSRPRPLSWVQ